MTIDFVRPMGVPPVREPRAAPQSAPPPVNTNPADDSQRPVAKDPVRGNALDVKG